MSCCKLRKREVKSPSFKMESDKESDIKEHDDETTSSDDEIARKDDETTRKDDETTRSDDETTRSDDETTDRHQEMKQVGTLYINGRPCRNLKMTSFFNLPSELEWSKEEGSVWNEEDEAGPDRLPDLRRYTITVEPKVSNPAPPPPPPPPSNT
uniref:Uncharacterized protein LOC111104116 isoform X3 n=1 Tax=Crassostrea virginica TaxID=6565 RepID=A0A8B8ARA5_CRAVI|nr:uncharacterized protein LOC111104116 isoform X3 [Crassostrea virginica]